MSSNAYILMINWTRSFPFQKSQDLKDKLDRSFPQKKVNRDLQLRARHAAHPRPGTKTFIDCDDLNDLTRLFSYVGQESAF